MLMEWNDLITTVWELHPEEEHTARKVQMPQVVYKGFGDTVPCGFPSYNDIPFSSNKYT